MTDAVAILLWEEAVLNAMIAAESVPTIKPRGQVLRALDHARLLAVMREHGAMPW